MSILKLSKNDIIRNEDKEEKIKLKRSDLSYDSARVSGWEQTNRQSLDILNDYNNKINKSEWLSEEDRATYRKALDSYIETANYLRGINKTFGEGYTDEDEKSWLDSIASMNSAYDSTEKYYSQWIDEKDYKGQRDGWFQKSNQFDDGYQFGDVLKTVAGSATDIVENLGAGIIGMGEAALDALVTLGPYFAQGQYYANGGGYNLQADQAFDQATKVSKEGASDFVKKDLYNEQEVAKAIIADPVKALTSIDAETDSVFGEKTDSLAQSAGQLAGTAGLQAVGVPWWLTTGATALGGESQNALNQGATLDQAALSGMVSAGAEILTEKIAGGISFGGKTLDDFLPSLTANISNKVVRNLLDLGIDMVGEGAEEVLSGVMSAIGQKMTYASEKEISELFSSEEALDSLIGGAVLGLGGGVIGNIGDTISENKQALDIYGNGADLVAEALDIDANNAYAQKMQTKLDSGKSLSGGQINRLVEANENALVSQDKGKMKAAVESRLTELGENGDVSSLADVIVKAQSGAKLTSSERTMLVNSKYGRRVSTELNPRSIESGEYSSKWAENIGTERINAEAYNRGAEASAEQAETAPVGVNAPVKENAVGGKISAPTGKANQPVVMESSFKTSGDGKTKVGDTEVSIKEIASVKNGDVTLRLEDGSTVSASDVEFSSSEEGLLYENVVHMGLNAATANAFINNYDGNIPVAEYAIDFRQAYRYGELGVPSSVMSSSGYTSSLSEAQKRLAYELGKTDAKYRIDKKQAKIDSSKADKTGQKAKKGRVYFDGSVAGKTLTERQRASLKGLQVVAEATGVDIHVFESKVVNGKRQGANGWYDPGKKEIHLDLHAGIDGNGLMLFTASHELTHHIREVAPAKFKVFADALLGEYSKSGQSIDELIKRKLETLEANKRLDGKTESEAYDLAYEEVVADAAESMLVDSNAIEALSKKLQAKDKGLWETIKDFIAKLVNRIKAAYEGVDPDSHEGKLVREMQTSAERLQKLWVDALLEASEVNTVLGENGIIVNSKTDSASLMSVRDVLTDADRKKVSKTLAERFGVTQGEAMDWLKAETSLASLILNPKYSQYLDYTGDPNEEAIKSNSDYPQGTVDFSNICKKRRDFTEVMNRVLRNFPNHVFVATDLAKIRTIMEQEGMEVACAICYVEDRRQLDGPVAQNFLDSLAIYREGGKNRPDGKPFNANQLKAFSLIEGDTYTPSIYELISLEGRNSLKAKNPAMEEAWVKFNNARGMQSVRLLLNDAEYKRQILKYSPSVVKRKNDYGGLRIYSFSDMEMFHLIDIVQVITDSATVGLSIQGYTKVNEYARAVKDTGEKLNRSLIPKGDLGYHIENGRVVLDFDTVEGIDINHPDFFDNIDNPNIGNIVIGINATQIKAAMTSKFIDQIIPFHTGQSNEVLGEKGIAAWENYEDFQSERDASTKKKSSHQINIYTEVINAAEAEGHPITNKVEFVNKFLEVCRENNLIPRFSDFLDVNENGEYIYTEGYHKFLVDFKTFDQNTGEYLPQMPVKPIFDNDYITKLLTDYVKSQQTKDAELKKAMPKVLDRITKEIVNSDGVKYSDRNPRKVTERDVRDVFDNIDEYHKDSYFPVRINTPQALIEAARQRGDVIENLPVVMQVKKAQQAMSDEITRSSIERAHGLSTDDMIAILRAMDEPTYIVYQENGRYAEIVRFETEAKKRAIAVIEIGENKNAIHMNGYEGGIYQVLVTAFVPDSYQYIKDILDNKKNTILPIEKKKGSSQRSSGSQVPSLLNESPFFEDIIPQNPNSVKSKFSDRENIGYHAGDLGKAEWLHQQGYYRGTGHFGTGTYFVGDEAKISGDSTYGKRPHHAVDFSNYHLYKVRDTNEGYKLHEHLRVIDGGISQEWLAAAEKGQFSLVSMVDVYDLAEEKFGEDKYSEEAMESAIHELAEKHGIELLSKDEYSKKNDIPLDDEDFPYYYVNDYLRRAFKDEAEKVNSNYSEFRDAHFWLKLRFGYGATKQALQKVIEYQNANADTRWHTDKKDSLATVFMKALGYEGIDVRGTGLDNTAFGSVIYDLKEDTILYSDRVTDKKTLDFLENQDHVTVYRAMQVIDGELYPPMAAKVKSDDGKKKLVTPSKIGAWEQAVERPDLIRNGNKFELDKANGSSIQAAYNPYFHTSASPLNDQFSSAYKRPNLVIVEGEIPASELTSGYRAEFAKDTVGETKWHSGPVASKLKGDKARRVFLSRWFKPVRIVPDSEVASIVAKTLEGENIDVPYNVVTPTLRTELEKAGVSIKYQDRNPDSYSNRSLLAGALETAVQNDVEREKLRQYKQKIDLINSEEQKLNELREQIKELSFKKGPRDTEAIRKLQFEANQAANRINTYDRQLLNLESTKALKGVLEREKAQARKRDAQKYKEALERYREKSAKTQRELMDRYQESRKRGVESRNKTAMRHKIKDVVNELNNYLLKGTKDKHVPIELQKAVAEALDAVNMDTVGAEERIAKLKSEMMRAKTPEAVQDIAKKIEHIEEMGGNMAKKISRLKTAYDSIINSDDPLVANSHDDVISSTIEKVMEYVGETSLRDMSLHQLEAVYDMYRMVLFSIRNANKAFKAKKSEEISVIANRVMEEVDKLGNKKAYRSKVGQAVSTFDWNNQKPVYAFERIGSDTFTEVFNNVRAGEDIWATDMTEAQAFREEQHKTYKYDSWDFNKRFGFTSTSGMHFELSLDQIMSLYAYSKREQAAEHLKRGGIVFDETTEVTVKNKLGFPVKFNPTEATAYNLSDETLADIISKLSPDQKAFVDVMQDYLSTTMGEKGNEVSLELYGVKLFKEKNYFPLRSATQFMAKAKEQQKGEVKIKNSGFSKETVYKANNPIVLTPFMDVWAGHVNEMSMYHAFVLALEDFYRVYNYKTPTSDTMATESVEMYLQNAHGKGATKYIDQLLKDLNGGARVDSTAGIINKLTGLFKKSAVFASASVVVQQPSAIARATALVDTKYFVGKPSKHKDTWAEVKKYAPVAVIKEMGYFDTGMGKSSTEWLKGEKTWKDKVDDIASKAPALADEYAWCAIWNAVKRETLHNHTDLKPTSEEFLKLVGERFTEVVTKTQVYDSVLSRSAYMRSKDTGMKMATAFMGEPTTSINMLENALIQGKRGNKKYAAKAIGGVISSMILNSILVSIVYAGRDDDEDKTYAEKYISTLTEELLDSFNPLTLIPFVKDIVSIVQGYDIERSDMAVITDLINAWKNLDSDNRSVYRKVEDFGGAIASIFGLPVKNVMRDVRGMYNTVISFINGEKTTGTGIGSAIEEAVTGKEKSNGQQLYDAMVKGDSAQIERIKGRFEDEKAVDAAIRKALRENDPRIKEAAEAYLEGDYATYNSLRAKIVSEGIFSNQLVTDALKAEYNYLKKKANEDQ